MASGIPIVQPRRGAATEIVETTGGGILVEPDNPDALAKGILELWRNRERRHECSAKGYMASVRITAPRGWRSGPWKSIGNRVLIRTPGGHE